ncbi:MAG: N-6 DNA methylase, partial [Treponema sp.]|nr:N-6 DNA methylase [Candidatus Treponema equifaecale]
MANIKSLTKDINGILSYLTEKLNWPIEVDNPEYASEEATWEYYPEAIGLSDSDFAKIKQLLQLRPLTGDQEWACFFVIFDESPRMSITAMRKILGALIYQKRNADDHKIWDKNNLLFVCQWGTKLEREIGFVHFDDSEKSLPTLKDFCFKTNGQDEQYLSNAEDRLKNLYWKFEGKVPEWTENWKRTFTTVHGQVIHDTEILTKELAKVAKTVQSRILEVFEIENEKGYVNRLFKKFKTNLVHDMSKEQFADMYAQTIAYGLFSARCLNPEESEFDPIRAIENIPNTNPFLRDLLKEGFAEKKNTLVIDELDLNSVVDLLKNTDISSIVQDFNKQSRNGREDPVIHFYENFLTEYDKETRMDRGVFYTPVPVVDFIVRSVDQILKTEFGIEDGLACDETVTINKEKKKEIIPKVQILDPATGTGTFLRQTILLIKRNFDEKHKSLSEAERVKKWNEYVVVSLLHRLFGFELMMAPYAVAHMKLAMALKDTGYKFNSASRLKVFLTKTGMRTKFCTLKDSIRSQRNVFETTKTGSIRIIQT